MAISEGDGCVVVVKGILGDLFNGKGRQSLLMNGYHNTVGTSPDGKDVFCPTSTVTTFPLNELLHQSFETVVLLMAVAAVTVTLPVEGASVKLTAELSMEIFLLPNVRPTLSS